MDQGIDHRIAHRVNATGKSRCCMSAWGGGSSRCGRDGRKVGKIGGFFAVGARSALMLNR